jgi:hypothetical protein
MMTQRMVNLTDLIIDPEVQARAAVRKGRHSRAGAGRRQGDFPRSRQDTAMIEVA